MWFRRCWVYLIHHDGCTSSYTPGACSLKSLGVVRARVGCLNPEVCRWKVERNIWFCSGEQQRENQNVQSVTLLPRVLVAVGTLLVFVITVICFALVFIFTCGRAIKKHQSDHRKSTDNQSDHRITTNPRNKKLLFNCSTASINSDYKDLVLSQWTYHSLLVSLVSHPQPCMSVCPRTRMYQSHVKLHWIH